MGKIARLQQIYDKVPKIACKGLCVDSCGPILMKKLEYERLGSPVFTSLTCPVLVDGRCSKYENRPLVCRLWGVVPQMPCPFGCEIDGEMIDGYPLLNEVARISPETRPTEREMVELLHLVAIARNSE